MTTKTNHYYYLRALAALVAALMAAGILALAGTAREAEAAFPGKNGKIAFASPRTTGPGVNNPTGDYEIFVVNANGKKQKRLTTNSATDYLPDWQPLVN